MSGVILMKDKDLEKIKVMHLLEEKRLTQIAAAKRLQLSERQVRNLFKRYKKLGDKGVISKKLGKPSNHQIPQEVKKEALRLIVSKYPNCGPTFTTEKLKENHNLCISVESVRKLMISNRLWTNRQASKPKIHPLRPRRFFFGELVQMDGSHHLWFEDRGPACALIVIIDDATSSLLGLLFTPTETLEAYFKAFRAYFLKEGRPLGAYCDRFSVFEVPRKNPLLEEQPLTQFARAMKELGVELIKARSPQAKGRVERVNRTLQDRLVKELRLRGISDIDTANAFLKEYLPKHNALFAVSPAEQGNVHRALDSNFLSQLDRIFSPNYERQVQNDLSFQYKSCIYQIKQESCLHLKIRREKITLWEDSEKKVHAQYKGHELEVRPMKEIEYRPEVFSAADTMKSWKNKKPKKPHKYHPYKTKWNIKNVI